MKVLIYSSKEIYDSAPFEGRAEADLIAYSLNDYEYEVVKTKFTNTWVHGTGKYLKRFVKRAIEKQEGFLARKLY